MNAYKRFDKYTIAVILLVLVSAGYTLLNISSRLLSTGFQDMTQVYMRIAFGTIGAAILLRHNIRWARMAHISQKDCVILFLMGTIGFSIGVYFITLGALHAKLVNVAVIFASVPFFTYLYSYIFLKKSFDIKLIILLIISLTGIAIVGSKSIIPRLESFGTGELYPKNLGLIVSF